MTRPVRWRWAAHPEDQELILLRAGPGSGRQSRFARVGPPPRGRCIPWPGSTVEGRHRAVDQQAGGGQQ